MDIEQAFEAFERFRPQEYPDVSSYMICSNCGHSKLPPHGDIHLPTCPECGIVDKEFISDEPEWRSGADDATANEEQCRVGAPENLDHFSLAWNMGTMIKFGKFKTNSTRRLATRHMHANVNHKDRSLYYAYLDMDRVGSLLSLPVVIMHDAKCKYRAFTENVLTRGAVRNGIKANCIFQACREHNSPRSKQEIADAFNIPARDLSRTFEMYSEQNPEQQVHVIGAGDLISRLFNDITCVPDEERGDRKSTRLNSSHSSVSRMPSSA